MSFQTILSYSRASWLSLMPAIDRILQMWEPLKEFFENETNAPKVLIEFFRNPLAKVYFSFVHSQSFLFHKQTLKMEKSDITIIEVKELIDNMKKILQESKASNFIGMMAKQLIIGLKTNPDLENDIKKFEEEVVKFYNISIDYIEKWASQLDHFSSFDWMTLTKIPEWNNIEGSILYLNEKGASINGDDCFPEFIHLKDIIERNIESEEWKTKKVSERWVKVFQTETSHELKEFKKICQYVFSIPGHNATVERIFSLMSAQWTDERNRLEVDTVEAILQCKFNFSMRCEEFYKFVRGNQQLLLQVKSSDKYKK